MQPRNEMICSLTALRFFAAIGIYICHISTAEIVSTISISFFFLLSGFVISFNYSNKFFNNTLNYSLKYFVSRLARIYPLHLLTFIIMIPIMEIYQFETSIKSTIMILFLLQTYIPLGKAAFGFNGVSWFLADILFSYAMTPLLLYILHHTGTISKPKKLIALQFCLYAIAIYFAYLFRNDMNQFSLGWWFISISPYYNIIYYFLGILTGLLFLSINHNCKQAFKYKPLIINIIEVFSVIFFMISVHCAYTIHLPFARNLWFFPSLTILIFVFAFQKGMISTALSFKPLVILGSISFEIYMLHYPIILYFGYIFKFNYLVQSGINAVLVKSILFIFIILISLGVNRVFENPARSYLISRFKKYLSA